LSDLEEDSDKSVLDAEESDGEGAGLQTDARMVALQERLRDREAAR
jgi:hypothetical protein